MTPPIPFSSNDGITIQPGGIAGITLPTPRQDESAADYAARAARESTFRTTPTIIRANGRTWDSDRRQWR